MTKLNKIYFKFRLSSGSRQVRHVCSTDRSLLAQTLNNFMQIKVKVLGYWKTTVKKVALSGAPRQFDKFISWFKVDGRIIANLIRLFFEEVAVCWMINTVAWECWVATGIYRGLPSSAKDWAWHRKCKPS